MKKVKLLSCVLILLSLPDLVDGQNVGISNVSFVPNYPLHIYHNAASGIVFQATNNTSLNTAADGFTMRLGNPFNVDLINNENGNISLYTNATERLRVNNSGISVISGTGSRYVNFGATLGFPGYGFRDTNGVMQYKNAGNVWTNFPNMPNIPGNVEWWIRPIAASYIRPMYNPYIRVYDTLQTYGLYFDGGKNQYGGWFRTTSGLYAPTAAVVGFSDVAGNQTYAYLGYNGTYADGTYFPSINGAAVYGMVDDPDRISVFGRTTGLASYSAIIGYSNVWIGGYFKARHIDPAYAARPACYGQMRTEVSMAGVGWKPAIQAYAEYTQADNPGITCGGYFTADAPAEFAFGVAGVSFTNSTTRGGGYFETATYAGTSQAYAYVATSAGGVNRKITGTAGVSEIIPTENHGRIMLTCPESPEYWYIDYGSVKMVDGFAHVDLDPILADICVIDEKNPIKVICQPNMIYCNGVAVINKTSSGFDIVEVNGGQNSGEIDFQIVAKPKTGYGEGRFPQAPGPSWLKPDKEPIAAKAKNQPEGRSIFYWPSDWEVYKYKPEDHVGVGNVVSAGKYAGQFKLGDGSFSRSIPEEKIPRK